ncbi:hypothetical protein L1987_17153 [Smallanthus sonchifolius]|uniref:Uncharacterized protein n=1 Tax=Smallanthus sonchifolius TaxID=185202 RepID=A0ACB9IWQ0_9ASTR|nr:hypothetical protein L1987_17153 [Smallanthus sonchifolius]
MAGEEDGNAVLSDVEEDIPPATVFVTTSSPTDDVSVERFRELAAELDRERKAREAAEITKSELQGAFNRLKVLAHEAIRKRDEISRQRDEVSRSNEELSAQLAEAVKERDEMMKQRDDFVKQLEESVKVKDSSRSEIEAAAQMLVTGIDNISGKVSNYKNFIAGGLPRSQKYTGLPAVAYGVIKRSNDIVEELLKQIESATKSTNEAREQVDQRNYEIAIEVSQLESTISELREDVSKKDSAIEGLEKSVVEKDGRITKLETEVVTMQNLVGDYDVKLKNLELQINSQRPLLVDQLNYVSKLHEQLCSVINILDDDKQNQSVLSDSMFVPQETDVEENIRACLAGLESISELSSIVHEKAKVLVSERNQEVKSLNGSVAQLIKEKEHIGSLLRSALSRRMSADLSSKTNELFRVAETGLKEAGIDYKFSNHTNNSTASASDSDNKDDEIYTLAGALENIIKQSQLEIIELKHTVDELRAETRLLKENAEAQAKELVQRREQVEKLKEKERVANENVEGLMMDIAAAEEEITRWKAAAQQEAEAGRAIEQEYVAQLSTVRQELEEAKQAVIESEKKLKFKEETATAAMAARDAAEKSLRLADSRAARLRERVEELTSQLEKLDTRENQNGQSRARHVCWPWQWLGLNFVGAHTHTPDIQPHSSNEMELSEPLI